MPIRRTILITGAGGGIGLEVSQRFAARGFRVLAVERDGDSALRAERLISGDVSPIVCDMTAPADVASLCSRIELDWADDLEVCFLNAGVIVPGDVIATDPEIIDLHLDVMLRSTAKLARSAALIFAERGAGHIVATVSQGAVLALPGSAAYSAAKAGLRAYLTALHYEMRGSGVSVGGVYPSAVDTEMLYNEAVSGGSVLNFVGSISSVADVADGVDRLIENGHPEEFVPRGDGITVRVLQSSPRLTRAILPFANRIGERGRNRYLSGQTR